MSRQTLPYPSTSFIGRMDELNDIAAHLANPTCRLLTLVGPGGIGKTRLAIQAAAEQQPRFSHGVYFVPLSSVTSPELLVSVIAGTFEIALSVSENPAVQIAHYLGEKRILLVLDNFENLLEGSELLTQFLQTAPGLKILVTSREKLNVQEEWVLSLEGLTFPTEPFDDALKNYSAVQLFVQRARQVQPHFSLDDNAQAVQAICQQVEGMPLGLELAATWLRALTCQQIVARMRAPLDFLTTPLRNVPERHRSLRAVFEQSWNLLSPHEQAVLMKLSIFRGGFDPESAEQVADASLILLAGLVDKSLIRLNTAGRYDLHELLRQYAADKLTEAGEAQAATSRHLDYFLHMAEQADAHGFDSEQIIWYDRLETQLDNLRAARTWSIRTEGDYRGLQLAAALGWFFSERSYWKEGLEWLEQVLAANPDAPPSLRAKALHRTGALAGLLGDVQRARQLCEQALALARPANDNWNIAWSLSHLGNFGGKGFDEAAAILEESVALFRELKDPMGITHTLTRRGWIAFGQHDYVYMRRLVEEVQNHATEAGNKIMIAWATFDLGRIAWFGDHDLPQARDLLESSLVLFRDAGFGVGFQNPSILLASVEQALGNITRAQMIYEEALISVRESAGDYNASFILSRLASIARLRGEFQRAARLIGAADKDDVAYQNLIPAKNFTFYSDLAALRTQLGEETFAIEWEAGQAMTRDQAIAYALNNPNEPAQLHKPPPNLLTRRELEILRLVADGLSNGEIAQHLHFTVSTVKWYLSEIYSKLGVHGRAKAVAHAREQGLLA